MSRPSTEIPWDDKYGVSYNTNAMVRADRRELDSMKTYIVYVDGIEQKSYIKASGHNKAEDKAKKLYPSKDVDVVHTEI